jgi:hypothetical protein
MYRWAASQGSLPVLLSASVPLTLTAPDDSSAIALILPLTMRSAKHLGGDRIHCFFMVVRFKEMTIDIQVG